MSEAPTKPASSPLGAPPAPPAADQAQPSSNPSERLYEPAGGDTQSASDSGSDTASGTDTQSGNDTAAGADSVSGDAGADSQSGNDSVSGAIELKLPEGVDATPETLAAYTTLAQEVGLNSEAAQRLLDFHYAEMTKANEATEQAWLSTINNWKAEIERDPVLGGEKMEAVQTVLGRALDTYGTPEVREAFNATGAGWNPHIVRFVHKMAMALNEGGPVPQGGPRPKGRQSPAATLYGDNNQQ